LIGGLDAVPAHISESQRAFLALLADAERAEIWRDEGARDMAHFVSMRYGISWWKADRWVNAGKALESLPRISAAFEKGELSIDKVVELARFATPETEPRLIRWAKGVSAAAIRRRADVESRPQTEEVTEAERGRYLHWWYLESGLRVGLEAEPPSADGAAVIRAIGREAARIPVMPGEEETCHASARRADALVALCTGDPIVLGRTSREPSGARMRQLRYRATGSVGSPAAGPSVSCKPTTSCGGQTVGGPTWTTWS
jgi:hypothetical protein